MKKLVPLKVRQKLRDWGPYGYCGDYQDWAEAQAASVGYDSPVILEKTAIATSAVRDGKVAFQQDGVALSEIPDYAYRLALILNASANRLARPLRVLDFGGALGGSYFGCRPLLRACQLRSWHVVEQAAYCDLGRDQFADSTVRFFETVPAAGAADVVVCLSSLQFVATPLKTLKQLFASRPTMLVLERTPFAVNHQRQLTVQRMPASLYVASYPSWLLSEPEIIEHLPPAYELWLSWQWPSAFTARANFKGLVFNDVGR